MKTYRRFQLALRILGWIVVAVVMVSQDATAQSTPQPTPPLGTNSNSVMFNSGTKEYFFYFGSLLLYKYGINDGEYYWQTGATLEAVQARSEHGRYFWPSVVGGISASFGGVERFPGGANIRYKRLDALRIGDTVQTRWRMKYLGRIKDSIDYRYRFHISGRTLVVRVQVENQSKKATGFQLERSMEPDTSDPRLKANIVRIPYLTLFNVLEYDGSFTSMFFDWEVTNASELRPWPRIYSRTSVWYAQTAIYKGINGNRRPLKETIYLTVSPNLEEVLPNLPGQVAEMRGRAADRNVLYHCPPYWWSIAPKRDCGTPYAAYSYLDSLKKRGVQNLAVIMFQWQKRGANDGLPDVLPANPFSTCRVPNCITPDPTADNSLIKSTREYIVNTLNYPFALYENYVDYYTDASLFKREECALNSAGNLAPAYHGCPQIQSFVLRPSLVGSFASKYSDSIKLAITPTWSYLDVHSAINPSERVDYDRKSVNPGKDSAGMFLYTLKKYRELPSILRDKYKGPVEGEGGNHFLYAGYYDGLDGRILTGDNAVYGYKAPLLVDFDLLKIHQKSALHGVGHYFNFFAGTVDSYAPGAIGRGKMLQMIATELAYGHGGLTTRIIFKSDETDHTIEQPVLEELYVLPVYKSILNSDPARIEYWNGLDGPLNASDYIRKYPYYFDHNHPDFMSRVRVTYDNGVVVCVNRSNADWPLPNIPAYMSRYNFHALVGTRDTLGIGYSLPQGQYTILPARNGWVCAFPFYP